MGKNLEGIVGIEITEEIFYFFVVGLRKFVVDYGKIVSKGCFASCVLFKLL